MMTREEALSVLGFQPGDNPKEDSIKRHYRKLARQHHPDRGGDPTLFNQVQEAYDFLTGKVREPDKSEAELGGFLYQVMQASIMTFFQSGQKLKKVDLLQHMKTSLEGNIEEYKRGIENLRRLVSEVTEASTRFYAKEGDEQLNSVATSHMESLKRQLDSEILGMEIRRKALEVLKRHGYNKEKVPALSRKGLTTSATSSSQFLFTSL